jgi:hypothetical protein
MQHREEQLTRQELVDQIDSLLASRQQGASKEGLGGEAARETGEIGGLTRRGQGKGTMTKAEEIRQALDALIAETSGDVDKAISGNQPLEIRRAPDFITAYSTSARVAYSEYDVRIFLGDVVFPHPSDKRKTEVVEERVCAILPIECAVSLRNALNEVIDQIEIDQGRR